MTRDAVAVVSGGMDSVTLAHLLAAEGYQCLRARHDVVDPSGIKGLLRGSALTDDVPVPEGHYAAPSMAATVVPNRNAIMLSLAYEETWSCYKGGELHCGVCGTCVERRETFELANVPDPTVYEVRFEGAVPD